MKFAKVTHPSTLGDRLTTKVGFQPESLMITQIITDVPAVENFFFKKQPIGKWAFISNLLILEKHQDVAFVMSSGIEFADISDSAEI